MTLPDEATKLTKGHLLMDHTYSTNSFVNLSARPSTSLNASCCYCYRQPLPRRQQIICRSRSWRFRCLVARFASTVILSMVILIASAQDVNNQQQQATVAADIRERESTSNNSLSKVTLIEIRNLNATHENITLFEAANNKNQKINAQRGESRLRNKGFEMPMEEHSGVSMNRNSLISGDGLLQRQLREKAKQDSLESIKMHILMRLNLKKLPNITKPIAVPQNILENFYKNYNASLTKNSLNGNHFKRPSTLATSSSRIDDIIGKTETGTAAGQQNIKNKNYNSEYDNSSDDNSSSEMQGDDANAFKDIPFVFTEYRKFTSDRTTDFTLNDGNDDEHDSILSHISSIYVFPEKHKEPHMRHNRKADVLRFNIDTTGYSDISYITLHLYLRGLDWINAHQPKLIEEIANCPNKDIVVTLQRAIRRANSTNYTHKAKMFEFRHKIPAGLGQWVNVDLKPLFGAERQAMMFSSGTNQSQEIFIKGVETWMRPLIVTTDSAAKNPLTVHIEIGSQKKHRRKRSVFMDCTESDHDMRCCRYPLKVDFTSFGWHFVVAPTSFHAYFCSGDCRVGYLEQYPHTHLAALTTSATPCCSPTKMSSLSLLYFDDNHNLVLSVIPNMSVEGCSCS